MARTIADIQQTIIAAKNADTTLAGLNSSSATAIWLLWTYIVAVCHWTLENLFDAHRKEVADLLEASRPHTLQWYVTRAKQYQHGDTLPPDSDVYATPTTDPAVRIIQFAAAAELTTLVRIKAATLAGGTLAPLTSGQLTAFAAYMQQIKDAGVRLQVTSGSPDVLRVAVRIYYDPLVLDSSGARLDGTAATPVKNAVKQFLTTLPFNGLFILNSLVGAIEAVEGVRIAEIVLAEATYASLPFTPVTVEYLPDAGYLALDEVWFDSHAGYVSHGPI